MSEYLDQLNLPPASMPFTELGSWFVAGIFAALMVVEFFFPARKLPKIRGWRIRGILSFCFFVYLTTYLPVFWQNILEKNRLLDLSNLGAIEGGISALLIYEFGVYVYHRTMHSNKILWLIFHQMHHSAERLDVFGAYYFSLMDMIGWSIIGSLASIWVGFSPAATLIALLATAFLGTFQHANIRTPVWLGYIIQRPESHSLHHASGIHKYNYSDIPIFDMLFGTFRNPREFSKELGFYNGASSRILDMLLFRNVAQKKHSKPKVEEGAV